MEKELQLPNLSARQAGGMYGIFFYFYLCSKCYSAFSGKYAILATPLLVEPKNMPPIRHQFSTLLQIQILAPLIGE